jgi:hypothetical protein
MPRLRAPLQLHKLSCGLHSGFDPNRPCRLCSSGWTAREQAACGTTRQAGGTPWAAIFEPVRGNR